MTHLNENGVQRIIMALKTAVVVPVTAGFVHFGLGLWEAVVLVVALDLAIGIGPVAIEAAQYLARSKTP